MKFTYIYFGVNVEWFKLRLESKTPVRPNWILGLQLVAFKYMYWLINVTLKCNMGQKSYKVKAMRIT